ncbi:hypothetical protein WDJ51_02510 [Rathayibacter sp. YIM 133350]|uniref:hypothetical protein n=1 Tax=Rathayibacter sp. YIM 133350 TaxID=3131992 RepID=UPI00307CEC1E
MTATLTDRYVYAVGRRVPSTQREELEREVRALVADTTDAKREEGSADPEREAIIALGDPDRLAATYTDRPLHLIGPALFPDYRRLLVMLYSIVLPIIVVVMFVVQLLARDSIGDAIGRAIALTIQVAVHLGFWTTLVFAILERQPQHRNGRETWTPEMLPNPDARDTGVGVAGLVGSIVWSGFVIAAILWQQLASPIHNASGDPIPVIDPRLWSFWLPALIVVMLAQVALTIAVYARRRWTYGLTAVRILIDVAFFAPLAWLALTGALLNPAFFAALGWPQGADAGSWLGTLIVAIALLAIVYDTVEALRDARKARLAGAV